MLKRQRHFLDSLAGQPGEMIRIARDADRDQAGQDQEGPPAPVRGLVLPRRGAGLSGVDRPLLKFGSGPCEVAFIAFCPPVANSDSNFRAGRQLRFQFGRGSVIFDDRVCPLGLFAWFSCQGLPALDPFMPRDRARSWRVSSCATIATV